jgi:hypothetical protein
MNLIDVLKIIDIDDTIHIVYPMTSDYYGDSRHVDYCSAKQVSVKYATCEVKRLYLDCDTITIEIEYDD